MKFGSRGTLWKRMTRLAFVAPAIVDAVPDELPLGSPRRHVISLALVIGTQRHNIQASLDWIDSH